MVRMTRRKKGMSQSELQEWIMNNHTVDGNGCWIWKNGKNSMGYGCYAMNNRMYLVHRFSIEIKLGRALTKSEDVRHICPNTPNRACYNPEHLAVGTHKENMEDMVAYGNSQKGVKNHHAKLTEEDVLSIRAQRDMFLLRELAEMYGVDQALISMVINGKIWKHVSESPSLK